MAAEDHILERIEMQPEWIDEFPFLRLAEGPASLVRPIMRIYPKTLRVPQFYICTTSLGNLTVAYPHLVSQDGGDMEGTSLNICGCDRDLKLACVKAVAEAIERYAAVACNDRDALVATANELGDEAIEWSRLPRGASWEYDRPDALHHRFDPTRSIRWIPGISLLSGRTLHVPHALAYVNAPREEHQYWLPVTTGMAAHTDVQQAMVNAICEVIERDALSLTWLLRLALPRLPLTDAPTLGIRDTLDAVAQSGVRHLMFDATTDVGVPTVYAVQLREGDTHCATVVSCATGFDRYDAAAKTIRECAATSLSFENDDPVGDCPEQFVKLEDGARYMSRISRRSAFSFLLESRATATIADDDVPRESGRQLAALRRIFDRLGMEVVIVDMTPADIRSSGLSVVRAVIPDLMPMSWVTRFRYLGHPRLLDYARRFGIDASRADNINPHPQPFA